MSVFDPTRTLKSGQLRRSPSRKEPHAIGGDVVLYAPEEPEFDCLIIRVPVLNVFDGDGFLTRLHTGGREIEATVRFGFIDAPEMGQPGGIEARDFLAEIIGSISPSDEDGHWRFL